MGDGPGYDHIAMRMEEEYNERMRKMAQRMVTLGEMNRSIGFGEPSASILETRAKLYLEEVYEILETLTREWRKKKKHGSS